MPRQPKLRKKTVGKSTYWFTATGGRPVYFGNVNDLSYDEAKLAFLTHQNSLDEEGKHTNIPSCEELINKFLHWIKHHRSDRTYEQRFRDCQSFANFKVEGKTIADFPAHKIRASDLEGWLEQCKEKGDAAQTLLHRQTSINHCWNWGCKFPSPNTYLPVNFRPFASVERVYVPPKVLTEDALITLDEVQTLFKAAAIDLDDFHAFGPKNPRTHNPYEAFANMLKIYYHTGARTSELARVEVGDFLPLTKQVVLGQHKTSKTQRTQKLRRITLNPEAMEIFATYTANKEKNDRIFTNSDNKPWTRKSLCVRFNRIKEVAELKEYGNVRDSITIYDFRHLWISDALMAGNDIATVARMAGTSVAMIEKVYGHFRNDHLQEAQAKIDEMRTV